MAEKKTVGAIYKVGAFLAFIMLGYLGLRSYKLSVEKLKTNECINQISEIYDNMKEKYAHEFSYEGLNYNRAQSFGIFPRNMFREGFKEATNAYVGAVDIWYSSLAEDGDKKAFEVSFQGLSEYACKYLLLNPIMSSESIIAMAGYDDYTPSWVLDEVLVNSEPSVFNNRHFFSPTNITSAKVKEACSCTEENSCTVVWKFR